MVPATQIVRTSRAAFVLTVIGAYIGGTTAYLLATWDAERWSDAMTSAAWASLAVVPLAALGATAGGLVALLCRCTMSRQYCWLFSVVAGMLALPLGSYCFSRVLMVVPALAAWVGRSALFGVFGVVPLFGGLIGGILLGVILTRSRTGMGKRSRRAAIVAIPIALACCSAAEIIFEYADDAGSFSRGPWQLTLTMALFCAVAAAGVAAACCAELPTETRWEVVPFETVDATRAVEAI